MSSVAPPGWSMVTGTWNTDARQSTTARSAWSIELRDTTVATKVTTEFIPVPSGDPRKFCVWVKASSVSSGNEITITLQQYSSPDEDDYITGAGAYQSELPNTTDWHLISGVFTTHSSAKFMRVQISKAAKAFSVYIDSLWFDEVQYQASIYASVATTLAAGDSTKVAFAGTEHNYGGDLASSTYTCPRAGILHVDAAVKFDTAVAGKTYSAIIYIDDTAAKEGMAFAHVAGTTNPSRTVSADIKVAAGDKVEIWAYNGDSSAIDTYPGAVFTYANFRYVD